MTEKKKVLFLTDSLGLPRLSPEPVYDEQVWTSLVAEDLCDSFKFYYYTIAGLHTSAMVANLKNQLGAFKPDVIVLQVGIVDSAPRSMKENERKVLERMPAFIRESVKQRIRKNYSKIILKRDVTYVSRSAFENNLQTIKQFFSNSNFVVVPIAPATEAYINKNPLIKRNIEDYNLILEKSFGKAYGKAYWETENIDSLFLSDNHHLSVSGNSQLSKHVITDIRNCFVR